MSPRGRCVLRVSALFGLPEAAARLWESSLPCPFRYNVSCRCIRLYKIRFLSHALPVPFPHALKRFLPRSQQARPLSNSIARTQSAADKVLVGSVTTSATVTRCDVSWRGIRPFGILHGRSRSDFRFSATVIRVSAFRPDRVPQQSLECGHKES